ncbi:MAG: hypothetical protein JST10_06665 [Bacteroidetes bacterium]|nr:hypothetical protein [Bacteroidota bacterium]MBS1632240.1 hypothetical protein [Bacteroidota bacterium]
MFYYLIVVLFSSCKKNSVNHSGHCSATKPAAEDIAIFPSDNPWNKDISGAPVDPYSQQIIAQFSSTGLHPDFGSGTWDGAPIGIPYVVVCSDQAKIPVVYRADNNDGNYGDESDPGPFPIPLNAPIEGNGAGDAHVIAVDIENKMLYELYNAGVEGDAWGASSGAVFNLQSNDLRPEGWTSADAAGLPIFPGLVRYDEIEKGVIDHAIRFTLARGLVKPSYITPARHKVNGTGGQYGLPFGAKLRLKNNFDISGYPQKVQVILKAMKKYGVILADIGSNLFISGAPDERWNNDELHSMGNIKGSDFEVIKFNN